MIFHSTRKLVPSNSSLVNDEVTSCLISMKTTAPPIVGRAEGAVDIGALDGITLGMSVGAAVT